MKTLLLSTRFKKELKRYKKQPEKIKSLKIVLKFLMEDGKIPASYLPHKLHGIFEGCIECHIENDFLLIWMDEENDIIRLLRLGTHHELFGK